MKKGGSRERLEGRGHQGFESDAIADTHGDPTITKTRASVAQTLTPTTSPGASVELGRRHEELIKETRLSPQQCKAIERLVADKYELAVSENTDGNLYNLEEHRAAIERLRRPAISSTDTETGFVLSSIIPTQEEVFAVLLRIRPHEWEAAEKYINEWGLRLCLRSIPLQSFIENLQQGKKNVQVSVAPEIEKELARQEKAHTRTWQWDVGIVETTKEPEGKEGSGKNIISWWMSQPEIKHLQLFDQYLYLLGQKGALLSGDGKPLDTHGGAVSVLQRADTPRWPEDSMLCPNGEVICGGHDVSARYMTNSEVGVELKEFLLGGSYSEARVRFALMKKTF